MDNQDHKASQWQTWNSFFAILKDVAPFFQQVEPKLHLVVGRDLEGGLWICWGQRQDYLFIYLFIYFCSNARSKWKESQDGTSLQGWVDMSCPKGTWSSQWPKGVLGPQTAFPLLPPVPHPNPPLGVFEKENKFEKKKKKEQFFVSMELERGKGFHFQIPSVQLGEAKREASWWVTRNWAWLTNPSCHSSCLCSSTSPNPLCLALDSCGRPQWSEHGNFRAAPKGRGSEMTLEKHAETKTHWANVCQGDQRPEAYSRSGQVACKKGLYLDLGLVRLEGFSNFLLKATGTHRRVSKQESYLVILGSL